MTGPPGGGGRVGADVVVDVTAKAPAAFAQAIAWPARRHGGRGRHAGRRRRPGFDPDHVVFKELRVLGALGVDTVAYRLRWTCWSRIGTRSRRSRGAPRGLGGPRIWCWRWPVRAMARRRCTAC